MSKLVKIERKDCQGLKQYLWFQGAVLRLSEFPQLLPLASTVTAGTSVPMSNAETSKGECDEGTSTGTFGPEARV